MTRIACLTMQKDEDLLLRPWLVYHGYLFGFENLHVCDAGSALESVRAALQEFAALGVNVTYAQPAVGEAFGPARVLGERIAALRDGSLTDMVVPMSPCEFLAIRTRDGIFCHRTMILEELHLIAQAGVPARTLHALFNRAGFVDLFRYLPHQRWVFPPAAFAGIDDALSAPHFEPDQGGGITSLVQVRMDAKPFAHMLEAASREATPRRRRAGAADAPPVRTAARAYYADPDPGGRPVIRFRGLTRLLDALTVFAPVRAAWEAGRPADAAAGAIEIDLDRVVFQGDRYIEANPDLSAQEPFDHFASDGFTEGRPLDKTPEARQHVMRRLADIRASRPDGMAGYGNIAACALWAGCGEEVDDLLRNAMEQFGDNHVLMSEFALSALNLGRLEEGGRRFEAYRRRHPERPNGYDYGWYVGRHTGDLDTAARIVDEGLQRFPDRLSLQVARAELAAGRGEWLLAKDYWNALLIAHPDNVEIKEKSRDVFYNIMVQGLEQEGVSAPRLRGAPATLSLSDQEIARTLSYLGLQDAGEISDYFLKFESVGLTCEFGFVQRHFGAEPISLFRWSAIRTGDLVAGLEADFSGLSDADNLVLQPFEHKYLLCDYRYNTVMHTFYFVDQVDPAKLHAQLVRRVNFLRRNFLDDLAAGEKIFVHYSPHSVRDEDFDRMRAAFRRHGKSLVLFVHLTEDPALYNQVEDVGGGLLLGHLEKQVTGPDDAWVINYAGWMTICRTALAYLELPVASE